MKDPRIVVVGAGPAGLTAARHLARNGDDVLVVEREREAGGIPRHSDHTGYGIRDFHRLMRGPAYAARVTAFARDAGARIETSAMTTDLSPDGLLAVTSPAGRHQIKPDAVVLATGVRERPRPARLIAGSRPTGVFTTGHLQNLVHLHGRSPGNRAVIVGSELVSWSAVLTLREAGCTTALMVTPHARSEAYVGMRAAGRTLLNVPLATSTHVSRLHGNDRLEAVEVVDTRTGKRRMVGCDTLVLTGDWVADNELARMAGIGIAPGAGGVLVDTALRTSRPGIFAAGNVIHPADTADVAAIDGRRVAESVTAWLAGERVPEPARTFVAGKGLEWISPQSWLPGDGPPPRNRFLAGVTSHVAYPVVTIRQAGRVVSRRRLPWPASPGRVLRIPARLLSDLDPGGGQAEIGLA